MICREEAQCGSVAEGEQETKHYVCVLCGKAEGEQETKHYVRSNVVMYASDDQ